MFLNRIKQNKYFLPWELAVFIAPFVYFFRYWVPSRSLLMAITNDFHALYFNYKYYFLSYVSSFWSLPLWSPMEASGYPFISNPFTAPFYPFNVVLILYYKIVNNYTQYEHQLFTVLGVSIFALGLFFWLRTLKISYWAAVFASIIISLSWKISDFMRFPNAIHTLAWIPWVLYAINLGVNGKFKKSLIFGLIFQLMLLTAGYPYVAVYSYILYCIYFFILFFNKDILNTVFYFDFRKMLKFFVIFFVVPVIVVSPYYYLIAKTMSQTVDRAGNDFAYSVAHEFGPIDTIASFIYPPAANSEGVFYFGIIPLLLIVFYFIYQKGDDAQRFKFTIFFSITAILSIIYGTRSFLFTLFWYFVPFVSSLRVWPRMTIILLPILALILAKSVEFFTDYIQADHPKRLKYLIYAFILIVTVQMTLLISGVNNGTWLLYLKQPWFKEYDFVFYAILSSILMFLILSFRNVSCKFKGAILIACLVVSLMDIGNFGRLLWAREISKERIDVQKNSYSSPRDIKSALSESFNLKRGNAGNLSDNFSFNTGVMPNFYYGKYVNFINSISENDKENILGIKNGKKLFFSKDVNYSSVVAFLAKAPSDEKEILEKYSIVYYDGDKLVVNVKARSGGYIHFIDNWDPYWKGSVNGTSVKMESLFGTFKSLQIQRGDNVVIFEYKPLSFFE